jgi:hypothetical protein
MHLAVALGHGQDPLQPLLTATVQGAVATTEAAEALGQDAAAQLRAAGASGYLAAAG